MLFRSLLTLSTTAWVRGWWALAGDSRRGAILHGLGLALPALYIAGVTIVFESGENMRYRFFLEPTLFVFFWISLATSKPRRGEKPKLAREENRAIRERSDPHDP